jgi:hypothetical protein
VKRNKQVEAAHRLLAVMRFLSLCQKSEGRESECHCILYNHQAQANNGVVALSDTIDEDLCATPHTERLLLALERCLDRFSITQIGQEQLQVRSGEFQAFVPCCNPAKLAQATPDAPVTAIDDRLRDALAIVLPLANEKATHLLAASVQLYSGSALATNRVLILEAWHGLAVPTMTLPKQAVAAIVNCGKSLVQLGYSNESATFYFSDGAWLKTQLYRDDVPDLRKTLDVPSNPRKLNPEFFNAIKQIEPFSESGNVYCEREHISSHPNYAVNKGSQLRVPMPNGIRDREYPIKHLKVVKKYAQTIDEDAREDATLFYGENVRGAIAHRKVTEYKPATEVTHCFYCQAPGGTCEHLDWDIPF